MQFACQPDRSDGFAVAGRASTVATERTELTERHGVDVLDGLIERVPSVVRRSSVLFRSIP